MSNNNKAVPAACPFCGNENSILTEHVAGTVLHPAYYERCDNCGAQGPTTDRGDHVEMWNQRAVLASADNPSTAGTDPIYQVQYVGEYASSVWHDASEDAYHTFMPERRRIVYAAPVAQSTAGAAKPYAYEESDGRTSELVFAQWFDGGYGKMDEGKTYTPLYLAAPALNPSDAQAPVPDLQLRKATTELSLPELAEQFAAVAKLGCDYTLSAGVCAMLHNAMTTPPAAQAPQQSETIDTPAEFIDYVTKNYPANASIFDHKWHAEKLFRAAMSANKAAQAAPSAPTDLSQRLRETADQQPGWKSLLTAAAEEIERYYGGMMAWKRTAEKKDRDWQAERMGRVDDRCSARAAAPAPQALADIRESARRLLEDSEEDAQTGRITVEIDRYNQLCAALGIDASGATKGAVSDSLGQEGGAA